MPITPLPQFEADLEEDRKIYEALKPPTSMVVRFGVMKLVGEFPYDGNAKPGCGSRMVVRTFRGTEMGEMLTSTCPNSGCSKSVSRKEMLEYIENSGGKDYPFYTKGRIIRVANIEDMNRQAALETKAREMLKTARRHVNEIGLPIKIVEVEPILGDECVTFYFTSEKRVDFRDLISRLAREYTTRIEMRQVGARDEARLVADYERCGQHCCCKQFLKVLKPVSMRMAKTQKATLDPLKISGRCGRLMCCLRYEDETYEDLRKRLPRRKSEVMTPDGPGIVINSQILTQLVLVRLNDTGRDVAVAVEELGGEGPKARPKPQPPRERAERSRQPRPEARTRGPDTRTTDTPPDDTQTGPDGAPKKKRRRRRKKRTGAGDPTNAPSAEASATESPATQDRPAGERAPDGEQQPRHPADDATGGDGEQGAKKKRRRRRRRRRKGPAEGGPDAGDGPSDSAPPSGGAPDTSPRSGD